MTFKPYILAFLLIICFPSILLGASSKKVRFKDEDIVVQIHKDKEPNALVTHRRRRNNINSMSTITNNTNLFDPQSTTVESPIVQVQYRDKLDNQENVISREYINTNGNGLTDSQRNVPIPENINLNQNTPLSHPSKTLSSRDTQISDNYESEESRDETVPEPLAIVTLGTGLVTLVRKRINHILKGIQTSFE